MRKWLLNEVETVMTRTKFIIFVAFILTMGAGMAIGTLGVTRRPRMEGRDSWLAQELNLTTAQQEKLRQVWMEVLRTRGREFGEQFQLIQSQREAEYLTLLSPEQKLQYEQINQKFAERSRELQKRGEEVFNETAAATREMLDESQRPKYDELLEKFRAQRGGNLFGPEAMGRMMSPATTQSSSTHAQ
jgi:hypothetical protein